MKSRSNNQLGQPVARLALSSSETVVISLDLHRLARALGGEVRNGQILAPGPGHRPIDRSMSVKLDPAAPDGFVVNCFSPRDDPIQCRDYVRERCGLPAFGSNGNREIDIATPSQIIDDATIAAALAKIKTMPAQPRGRIVKTFDYEDESGTPLYQVVRLEPKSFRQRRPNGSDWIWSLGDVRRVPYRLPDLIKHSFGTVFVCEGEKDADRLAECDLCSTCIASGAWEGIDISVFKNRDCMIIEDNDEAGRKKALDAATRLHGIANTVRIIRLPGLPERGDVSDWLDLNRDNVERLIELCFDFPLWTPESAATNIAPEASVETRTETDIPVLPLPASLAAVLTTTKAPPPPSSPLSFINVTAWHGQPVPEREWAVLNRIPMRNVCLFSGEGAIGKSIISLQLSVAHVLGKDWLGTMPEPGPVLCVACEDDESELHRRLARIVDHYGASFADLKELHLMSLAGEDALLATPDRNGLIKPTTLFTQLRSAACYIRPKLIVLDNSADIYGGSENDRMQVRMFIGILRNLAIAASAGVLLTSHPSLTGISTNTGLSGSTAWNASVRSRMWMRRATTESDEEPDPDLRVIEVMKSNYGPVGETITVRWKNGLFLSEALPSSLDTLAKEKKADEMFVSLLTRLNERGEHISPKHNANMFAPTVLAREPEAKAAGLKKGDFEAAMRRLFDTGGIHLEPYGSPCRDTKKLVPGGKT